MATNKTTQAVLELVEILKVIPCETIHTTITASSKEELEESAAYLQCRVYSPFEAFENDFIFYDYVLKNMRITVRGKEIHRKQTIIVEI